MKKLLKLLAAVVGVFLALLGGFVGFKLTRPPRDFSSTPQPAITASSDPAVIARGEYVVHALAHCPACHGPAERVAHHALAPDKHALEGGYAMEAGPFGTYFPANLTSDPETGLGKASDGAVARAIRHGVDRTGHLAAFMKFSCGEMADEDLTAVVSYLRTLPPVKNVVPADEWGVAAKLLAGAFEPRLTTPPKYVPGGQVSRDRGEYLANGPAHCHGCHTAVDPAQGMTEAGPRFAGEAHADPDPTDPKAEFIVPNLTPDLETGVMASWTEEAFVARFRKGRMFAGSRMPWENFGQMTDEDLKSLFAYLHSLPPTRHVVGPSRRAID